MDLDLPYVVEYAKSGRSACKKCKDTISKDALRVGIMVQSPHFDGKMPMWHHLKCFFLKKKLNTTGDIRNFAALRYEDQQKIKGLIGGGSNSGGKTAAATCASYSGKADDYEFCIEYAKSNKSSCRVCHQKIEKDAIRVSKLDYSSEHAMKHGPCPGWHHLDCFAEVKNELDFASSGDQLPGFMLLSQEDQDVVKQMIKSQKKRKGESENGQVAKKKVKETSSKDEETIQAQNKLYYQYRDELQKQLKRSQLTELLVKNGQTPLVGDSRMLDSLADCMTFGALEPCPECKGQLKLGTYTYKCTGDLTEWTRCEYKVKVPKRKKFVVPKEYAEKFEFLKNYVCKKQDRVFPENPDTPSTSSSVIRKKSLTKFQIVIVGDLIRGNETAAKTIEDLGGKLMKKITKNTTCVITNKDEAANHKIKINAAEKFNVFVLSEDFLDAVQQGDVAQVIKHHQLFPWGGDPLDKLKNMKVIKEPSAGSVSKSVSRIQKVVAQGGAAVDPDSGLDNVHVYEENGVVYNVVLGAANIQTGHNSYYKMQILESNNAPLRYYVFYSWGRVGTTIGSTKLESFKHDVSDAVDAFEFKYKDKTNNEWENRKKFRKYPRFMYPLDIDYGQDIVDNIPELKPGANSKLPNPVQQLICLIFDVEKMKKAMLEFEIDLQKMPLGKLSKKQIQSAYSVLNELLEIIKGDKNDMRIKDASNRFYTLIPHDFGMNKPTMLDTDFMIKVKTEMLDSLLEIEVAYNMLKDRGSNGEDPIDMHYKQLKTDIEVLDQSTNEFQILEKYLKNTHAETHNQYNLEIIQIFKVNRYGELGRYNKFKKLHNKMLLWHGSRTTNFAGILSQGLRIAPPEAPSTGYMFGKGIYFADMVSKSANYCFTNSRNPTGLLLLCEVALGNMYEKYSAEFVQTLPKDMHSTKGVGKTGPDPKGSIFQNGVEIPLGTPVTDVSAGFRSLLYNEYIVYDVNQVNIKYLLEVNFKWRR